MKCNEEEQSKRRNNAYDGMKTTDMADNIHKLEETWNDIPVACGCDG